MSDYYSESLHNRLAILEEWLASFDPDDATQHLAIRRTGHQLRGSGASFGYPRITDRGGAVEDAAVDQLVSSVAALIEEIRVTLLDLRRPRRRILIIDDDDDLCSLLSDQLSSPVLVVDTSNTVAEAARLIRDGSYEVILLDLKFAGADGRDLLATLGPSSSIRPDIIIISGKLSPTARAECVALGATHLFDKPIDVDLLRATIAALLERRAAIDEEVRLDILTQLPNRAGLEDAFRTARAQGAREKWPVALAVIDLDRFKLVNDAYGHPAGDAVLREVARVLGATVREADTVARWGGDEFVVIMPNTDERQAREVLGRCLDVLQANPIDLGDVEFTISFSVGLTQVPPAADLDDVFAIADAGLLEAKRSGRTPDTSRTNDPTGASIRVLIVEDEDLVAELLRVTLTDADGLTVLGSVGQVDEAVRLARNLEPDIILMDVDLGDESGLDAVRRIRQDRPSAQIIMLTASRSAAVEAAAFAAGCAAFVTKSKNLAELVETVRRVFAGDTSRR